MSTELGTSLAAGEEARASTVEHVMAALAAAGVTRAIVELDGPEPPILDGSFRGYLEALTRAENLELEDPVQVLRLPFPITEEGSKGCRYVAVPSDDFRVAGFKLMRNVPHAIKIGSEP